MSTSEKIIATKSNILSFYERKLGYLLSICESEIEKLFLLKFIETISKYTVLNADIDFIVDSPDTERSYDKNGKSIIKVLGPLHAEIGYEFYYYKGLKQL